MSAPKLGFDAFLSYSRSSDGEFVARLHRDLERFGKGIFRARRIRVFRDRSNLPFTPALRATLKQHIDRSGYLLLVASPASARSEWVQFEVDAFLARGSDAASRFGIVVTSGRVPWIDGGECAGQDDCAISSGLIDLFRAAGDQPRCIDLRERRPATNGPRTGGEYWEAIADIAAGIGGQQDKDVLLSEHVRARNTQWSAFVGLVAGLVVVTLVGGFIWSSQSAALAWSASVAAHRTGDTVGALAWASEAVRRSNRFDPSRAIYVARAAQLVGSGPIASVAIPEQSSRVRTVPDSDSVWLLGSGSPSGEEWSLWSGASRGRVKRLDVGRLPRGKADVYALRSASLVGAGASWSLIDHGTQQRVHVPTSSPAGRMILLEDSVVEVLTKTGEGGLAMGAFVRARVSDGVWEAIPVRQEVLSREWGPVVCAGGQWIAVRRADGLIDVVGVDGSAAISGLDLPGEFPVSSCEIAAVSANGEHLLMLGDRSDGRAKEIYGLLLGRGYSWFLVLGATGTSCCAASFRRDGERLLMLSGSTSKRGVTTLREFDVRKGTLASFWETSDRWRTDVQLLQGEYGAEWITGGRGLVAERWTPFAADANRWNGASPGDAKVTMSTCGTETVNQDIDSKLLAGACLGEGAGRVGIVRSRDGRWAATVRVDLVFASQLQAWQKGASQLQVWSLAGAEPVSERITVGWSLQQVAFSEDSRFVLLADDAGEWFSWPIGWDLAPKVAASLSSGAWGWSISDGEVQRSVEEGVLVPLPSMLDALEDDARDSVVAPLLLSRLRRD